MCEARGDGDGAANPFRRRAVGRIFAPIGSILKAICGAAAMTRICPRFATDFNAIRALADASAYRARCFSCPKRAECGPARRRMSQGAIPDAATARCRNRWSDRYAPVREA
ncbi:hypothetical protein Pden_1794 [Paracoccus denitrificans PD1222]|uniref:Uncharacterized protein n=1 Tax=Paracoccus denitrificans (strain Pd 1222) TaxID=318586 RepID=A1B2Z7_PARDP|nr:hypothetical protein Pden_1794 [Paracoccus denitrificans PD1222]